MPGDVVDALRAEAARRYLPLLCAESPLRPKQEITCCERLDSAVDSDAFLQVDTSIALVNHDCANDRAFLRDCIRALHLSGDQLRTILESWQLASTSGNELIEDDKLLYYVFFTRHHALVVWEGVSAMLMAGLANAQTAYLYRRVGNALESSDEVQTLVKRWGIHLVDSSSEGLPDKVTSKESQTAWSTTTQRISDVAVGMSNWEELSSTVQETIDDIFCQDKKGNIISSQANRGSPCHALCYRPWPRRGITSIPSRQPVVYHYPGTRLLASKLEMLVDPQEQPVGLSLIRFLHILAETDDIELHEQLLPWLLKRSSETQTVKIQESTTEDTGRKLRSAKSGGMISPMSSRRRSVDFTSKPHDRITTERISKNKVYVDEQHTYVIIKAVLCAFLLVVVGAAAWYNPPPTSKKDRRMRPGLLALAPRISTSPDPNMKRHESITDSPTSGQSARSSSSSVYCPCLPGKWPSSGYSFAIELAEPIRNLQGRYYLTASALPQPFQVRTANHTTTLIFPRDHGDFTVIHQSSEKSAKLVYRVSPHDMQEQLETPVK